MYYYYYIYNFHVYIKNVDINFLNTSKNYLSTYNTYDCYIKGNLVELTNYIKFIIIILQKTVSVIY
jgi:hypothetical protein